VRRVLLHGFLGDPSVWTGIVEGAAIALPGHGAPIAATWEQNIDAIAAQIGSCDVVVGYSLGARVALGLLATSAVPRAVLISVNPGIIDWRTGIDEKGRSGIDQNSPTLDGTSRQAIESDARSEPDERIARRASDACWARRFRTEPLANVLDAWEAQPLFATQARVSPDVLAARRSLRLALESEQIARSLETMGLAEMPDYRAIVDERCTLIVGADDAKYVAIARSLSAPVHVIDHCGHDPLLEQPVALAKVLSSIR
jgi:2-succinyl-6-hydroxy-2,4-cyclohexadiene-1-carboxylate synthase